MNEGSPSTLQTLVRTDGLTKTQWLHVLDNLRQRLGPFLDTITLDVVGNLRLPGAKKHPKAHGHRIRDDLTKSAVCSIDARGFFFLGETIDASNPVSRLVRGIWGLGEHGDWVTGHVEVDCRSVSGSAEYQTAKSFELWLSQPETVVRSFYRPFGSETFDFRCMWMELVQRYNEIVAAREARIAPMRSLKADLDRELAIIHEIPATVRTR